MKTYEKYGGIDQFRLIAALLIVGIHIYPLFGINEEMNFWLVHIFSRIAVPFFLMVTGFFLLPRYLSDEKNDPTSLLNSIKKTGLIYVGATILYFPISIYAGYYSEGNVVITFIRNVLFDGTFYHLWYLPASIIGMLLLYVLGRKFTMEQILGITAILYLLGLFGDSYYGITSGIPFLNTIYNGLFHVFSYTRNGLLYAPIFLAMGGMIAKRKWHLSVRFSLIGFIVSMALMLVEGLFLNNLNFQRHSSMYVMLIPCMFFLFNLLLRCRVKASPSLRGISMWIFVLHPLFIIVIRGFARVTGLESILVENHLIHYLAVCLLSYLVSVWLVKFHPKKKPNFPVGRAWIELDMKNLRHNIHILQSRLPKSCQLMAAVKADAYGHGALQISKELNASGISAFCVASVLEGVALRKHGIKGKILVLGYTHPKQFHLLIKHQLTQTVIDYNYAKTLDGYGRKFSVHINVDTGMNRLGERSENIDEISRIFMLENLDVCGIYTHLCACDSDKKDEKNYTHMQIDRFHHVITALADNGFDIPKKHILSSYGVFNYPESAFDYVRVGIALYGMLSTFEDTNNYETGLRPVLSVKTRISAVKELFAGELVGYGLTFKASKNMTIAVVAIGYADGVPRELSCGVGYVLINGKKASIISRVCMDQMIVDITDIDHVRQGDIAVIIGKSGELELTVCEIAEQAGTIANEVLSQLGHRLERRMV